MDRRFPQKSGVPARIRLNSTAGSSLLVVSFLLMLGVALTITNPHFANLRATGAGFVVVSVAGLLMILTSWLESRDERAILLVCSLLLASLLFVLGFIILLASSLYS
jgi:hypothetical protein